MNEQPKDNEPADERVWEQGWEGHERAQQERLSKLPFAKKLEWLEQAHRLVRKMQERENGGSE